LIKIIFYKPINKIGTSMIHIADIRPNSSSFAWRAQTTSCFS